MAAATGRATRFGTAPRGPQPSGRGSVGEDRAPRPFAVPYSPQPGPPGPTDRWAPPESRLIRLHRHSLMHLLLEGGTAAERKRVAFAFHLGSPLRRGAFVRVEGPRDEDRLRCALEHLLSAVTCERPDNPLRESEGGTLFVDHVSLLSPGTQHVLLRVLAGLPGVSAISGPCFGRLAVGSEEPLEAATAAGRFHPALFDILDKIRVELRSGSKAGSR